MKSYLYEKIYANISGYLAIELDNPDDAVTLTKEILGIIEDEVRWAAPVGSPPPTTFVSNAQLKLFS